MYMCMCIYIYTWMCKGLYKRLLGVTISAVSYEGDVVSIALIYGLLLQHKASIIIRVP